MTTKSKAGRAVLDSKKLKRLAEMGGRVTTVAELLGLTPADVAAVEARLAERSKQRKR